MSHTLTLRKIEPVTHDTRHLVFDKPAGFDFVPGQSAAMTLHRDGWRDRKSPFSFVSLPEDDTLEFIFKVYERDGAGHGGMTAELATLEPGETVDISDPFGTINDRGPGVFIAGGAGITPFVPILRRRARDGDGVTACTLIYCNKTEADIILRDEWVGMDGLNTIFTVTDDPRSNLPKGRVDGAFLDNVVEGFRETFYVCGPEEMTRDVIEALRERDVADRKIVREEE